MKKILYLSIALALISQTSKSQELRPYQFIQFFKVYQLENSIHLLSGTECLKGYDKQWMFIEAFTVIGNTEDMHFWAYGADNSKQFIHKVSGSTNKVTGNHYIEYEFNEPHLYQQYLTQITNMNGEDGGVSKVGGGTGHIYNVGGLTFVLRTFPAGIKDENVVYTIALTEDKK